VEKQLMAVTLKAILGFDGKAYEAGMRKAAGLSKKTAQNIAGNLKGAVLGTLSVGYMAAKAKEVGEFAKQVKDLAPALGMTTDELQQWEYVFARVGLDLSDVADALATLSDRAEDALAGTQSMIEDFRLIGITVDQLRGKNPQQLFDLFADAVSRTTDTNRSLTAIVRSLGDDLGRKLAPMLMEGAEGMKRLREEAQSLGIVINNGDIDKLADRMNEIKIASLQLRGIWASIVSMFSSVAGVAADVVKQWEPGGVLGGGLGYMTGGWEADPRSSFNPGKWVMMLGNFWTGMEKTVNRRWNEIVEKHTALELQRIEGWKNKTTATRAMGGINDELESKKAEAALQKKINDAAFKEMSKEQQLNSLLGQRLKLFEQIKKASGKQKFELMGQEFDLLQQIKGIEGTATAATGRRAMSQTGAQGVGAFVRRANPMLQVSRQQLQIQRESKFVLDAILASGYRPANTPY
jgi:hypothetical protein